MRLISNGRGKSVEGESVAAIVAGNMVSTDLAAARAFYETFLGFECVRYATDRMLIRDKASKKAMERGDDTFTVIEVREVESIAHPRNVLNHWGLTVATTEEVDRIHAEAKARREEFGITKIMPITKIHGAYGFYFADRDRNWWEIECRVHGMTNEMVFEKGDFPMP